MKQFYSTLTAFRFTKSLFSAVFLLVCYSSGAQTYFIHLSNETPSNVTIGSGSGMVTISGNMMRVQASFKDLTGNTTASHIHAATAVPGVGSAGVATTVPTFPGFPLTVKAGSYDASFDMTLASSYNPAYITANGGTPASAFAALKAAINAGKSYLNIHTNVYPSGEIRGFLMPCPAITVTIPDAFALSQGVLPNTVYPAYAPASALTLQASVSGGTGPYTYNWSTGGTASSLTVSPAIGTSYSLSVRDQNGCPGTASKMVNVVDISSGKKGDKIDVCHNGNTLSIASPAVAAHLAHGDMLDGCSEPGMMTMRRSNPEQGSGILSIKALSNPAPNYFELQITASAGAPVQLTVYDLMGRLVESRSSVPSNQTVRIGNTYRSGVYLLQLTQGAQKQMLRLVKGN